MESIALNYLAQIETPYAWQLMIHVAFYWWIQRGQIGRVPPSRSEFFQFHVFSRKTGKLWGWRPLQWEKFDPPLKNNGIKHRKNWQTKP